MKTVFKVGMTVYDSFYFQNKVGTIKEIRNVDNYPIIVEFKEENKRNIIQSYTLEGYYRRDSIPTLSTKPYKIELQNFEQKEPVPTFEDAWKSTKKIYVQRIGDYEEYEGYTSQEMFNAFEALRKLIFLRDYYNEDWEPDWKDDTIRKYNIFTELDKIEKGYSFSANRILSFKTEEVRNNFFKEQRGLLEIAKLLL